MPGAISKPIDDLVDSHEEEILSYMIKIKVFEYSNVDNYLSKLKLFVFKGYPEILASKMIQHPFYPESNLQKLMRSPKLSFKS